MSRRNEESSTRPSEPTRPDTLPNAFAPLSQIY